MMIPAPIKKGDKVLLIDVPGWANSYEVTVKQNGVYTVDRIEYNIDHFEITIEEAEVGLMKLSRFIKICEPIEKEDIKSIVNLIKI